MKELLICPVCNGKLVQKESDENHGGDFAGPHYWRCENCELDFDFGTFSSADEWIIEEKRITVWVNGEEHFASDYIPKWKNEIQREQVIFT